MSEAADIEKEQETPQLRERATGRLIPLWAKATLFIVLGCLSAYAIVSTIWSLYVQHVLTDAVALIEGGMEAQVDFDSQRYQQALDDLTWRPLDSFLYCNQELLQDEEDDPRMARSMALQKAVSWEVITKRRDTIRKITEEMDEGGGLNQSVLTPDVVETLRNMVEERRAETELSYAEQRITDVLAWLIQEPRPLPKGFEKRRLESLLADFQKKDFVGPEVEAVEILITEWDNSDDPVRRDAVPHFRKMLQGEHTAMPDPSVALCRERADYWEQRYLNGMLALARAGKQMLTDIVNKNKWIDHPHIYQYISLLRHRGDRVREQISEGVWLIRHRYYTIRFLGTFAARTSINPVMAVETVRLTRDEHEREMRQANVRRVNECMQLLIRVGLDYLQNREQYELPRAEDQDAYVRRYVVHNLELLSEEPGLAQMAQAGLQRLREADKQLPGGPVLFTE